MNISKFGNAMVTKNASTDQMNISKSAGNAMATKNALTDQMNISKTYFTESFTLYQFQIIVFYFA